MPGGVLTAAAGLFGKLPSHGDFLRRGLPASFVSAFDAWLQEGIATSRLRLGEGWLERYLVMPAWRFAIASGLCGPDAVAGVLIPSVDHVGRHFPFVLAAPLEAPASPLALHREASVWYDEAEALALSALDDGFALEAWLERLEALGRPDVHRPTATSVRIDAGDVRPSALAALELPMSLWWTVQGSPRVPPCAILARGLPAASAFCALLDADGAEAGIVDLAS